MTGVSIVLCCYNSAARLPDTLRHIARQSLMNVPAVEVIVVNNNSTDRTSETAREVWTSLHADGALFVVDEPLPGLTHARRRGVRSASHEVVIFCDDDNWLAPDYVARAFDFIMHHPECAALGGKPEAAVDTTCTVPEWFAEHQDWFAVGKQAETSGDVTKRGYVWGAGMVTRKSLFMAINNEKFPLLLSDRSGTELTSGGDAEICLRYVLLGYRLFYDEQLKLSHYIPCDRLTPVYRDKLYAGLTNGTERLSRYYYFIEHHLRNPYKPWVVLKWRFRSALSKAGIAPLQKNVFVNSMLTLFTSDKSTDLSKEFDLMKALTNLGREVKARPIMP